MHQATHPRGPVPYSFCHPRKQLSAWSPSCRKPWHTLRRCSRPPHGSQQAQKFVGSSAAVPKQGVLVLPEFAAKPHVSRPPSWVCLKNSFSSYLTELLFEKSPLLFSHYAKAIGRNGCASTAPRFDLDVRIRAKFQGTVLSLLLHLPCLNGASAQDCPKLSHPKALITMLMSIEILVEISKAEQARKSFAHGPASVIHSNCQPWRAQSALQRELFSGLGIRPKS